MVGPAPQPVFRSPAAMPLIVPDIARFTSSVSSPARFRRSNGRHAEDAFDRFQTRLANQYALGAGQETVARLCAKSASFLQKAQSFVAGESRHYMARQAAEERHAYTSCAERSAGNTFTPD